MTDTSGFYKLNPNYPEDPNVIDWAQFDVTGPGYELYRQGHEHVTYPVQGWWWFDSREEARAALIPASVGKLDAQALQPSAALSATSPGRRRAPTVSM